MQNQFDCIDLSGNNIIRLDGFPKLPRLKMLICCNNRISTFAAGLERMDLHLLWTCLTLAGDAGKILQIASPADKLIRKSSLEVVTLHLTGLSALLDTCAGMQSKFLS
jgi:Leucine-rich repeat